MNESDILSIRHAAMTAEQLINILASIALFELMLTIGLDVTFSDAVGVAGNWQLLIQAALANYVCVPAAAIGLLAWFQAQPLVAAGFLVVAVCPGAPYSPPFTAMARGNSTLAIGLMVVLAASSAIMAPILLRLLLPLMGGSADVQVDAVKMVSTLMLAQFLPLCIGLSVRHWRPAWAKTLRSPATVLSIVLNLAMLGAILTIQFATLINIPGRAYAGMFLLVMASVAAGWVLGGPGTGNRTAMMMVTGVRNVGVGLVIATGAFAGTPAVVAATAFGIFQTIAMALIAFAWGRWLCP